MAGAAGAAMSAERVGVADIAATAKSAATVSDFFISFPLRLASPRSGGGTIRPY
jgi:hypothetical protein